MMAGFDSSSLKSSKIFVFMVGNNFGAAIDSGNLSWSHQQDGCFINGFLSAAGGLKIIRDSFEYVMQLPAVGRTFRIREIKNSGLTYGEVESHDPPMFCFNDIIRCMVNDSLYVTHYNPSPNYRGIDTVVIPR
jgi:hypothetical protein